MSDFEFSISDLKIRVRQMTRNYIFRNQTSKIRN
jgi:hypothetical protein